METTAADGKKYKTKYYNLDAITSIGYRANSTKTTEFRIWATNTFKEYIIKGFGIIGFPDSPTATKKQINLDSNLSTPYLEQ